MGVVYKTWNNIGLLINSENSIFKRYYCAVRNLSHKP